MALKNWATPPRDRSHRPSHDEQETIECAVPEDEHPPGSTVRSAANGERSIWLHGHIRMMGATQPFISRDQRRQRAARSDRRGHERSPESWRLGAKAISIIVMARRSRSTRRRQVADANIGHSRCVKW
jgi:hypothetical protein